MKKVKVRTRYGKVIPEDDIDEPQLLAYKVKRETEATVFYCPYVPLTTTGVVGEEEALKNEIEKIEKKRSKCKARRMGSRPCD